MMGCGDDAYCLATGKTYCSYCPGYCCYSSTGASLYIMAEDINRLARHFGISDGEVRQRFMKNKKTFKTREDGSCIFLATDRLSKRCTIHQARPKQCRDFPYDAPCPYLSEEKYLGPIQAKIEHSLLGQGGLDCSGPKK